jgi:N-acetylglucosaminyl-diphospho-decaprenol L-rhamnosyltransferase
MTGPLTVGAVVVNYNAGDHLVRCVAALRAESIEQIAVVDNGSHDGSVDVMKRSDPEVLVVDTGDNLGYGRAANRGTALLVPMPDAVLVSNPDVVVHPGTVKALVAALEDDPSLGIVGPRIENPDGTVYPSARTFPVLADAVGHAFLGTVAPRNRWTRRYRMLDWDHSTAQSVDWISGACFLVRTRTWQEVGGFDDTFFMYMEDVDLCWRARARGWGVAYEPSGRVTHVQGVSADRHPYRMIVAHHRSMFHFAARTTTGRTRWLLPLMAAGRAVRTVLACAERLVGSRRSRIATSIR